MKRYRIKPYDLGNDLWVLQERKWLFFWVCRGAGKKSSILMQLESALRDEAYDTL